MSACGRKALTLLSSVFAVCSLGLLGIAVSTDYWLYLEEGVILPLNQSADIRMSIHSGLWRVCFLAGEERGRCFTIEYVMPMSVHISFRKCFLLSVQSAGVMSVYLFMKRYTAEEIYQPHPSFYRPRLSNCSDYSGQFLQPNAWTRGRSPSDISSDTSLQMNASYPALLKCPDYAQVSSSPC
uniref:Calcium voltage-gated channel auxiliary subunit gamma 5 n=1 Tax=Sinocyclocheilus grahami TaxID=75366 RepID=A0A672L373_SINGR